MSILTFPETSIRRSRAARVFTHLRTRAVAEVRGLRQEIRDVRAIAGYVWRHVLPPMWVQLRHDLVMMLALGLFLAGIFVGAIALGA